MAQKVKHTAGPWVLDPPGSLRIGSGFAVKARTPEGPGFPTPSATGFYCIAEPPPHGRDKAGEQEANARLIAAAPELLEVCREMIMHVNVSHVPAEVIDGMRAAIAKAEGRS